MQKIDLTLYLISTFLGSVGAWVIAKWGLKLSLVDKPNSRSSHNTMTSKGGGIGILAAFIYGALCLGIPIPFVVAATLISLFSFWGDMFEISPKIRLPLHFAAAFFFFYSPHSFFSSDHFFLSIMCVISLSVFIVGTANFYNFMDGIDGIAGITGIIAFCLIGCFAFLADNDSFLATMAICISLACLGFLPFNLLKAKVFMGDVGSILLGFVFAGMVVLLSGNVLDFICLASFLFPFYADELTTMLVRIKDGEKLSHPHRRHLYQLLANELKIEHWKVSAGYGLLQLMVGISVLLLKPMGLLVIILIFAAYFAGFSLLSFIVRKNLAHKI